MALWYPNAEHDPQDTNGGTMTGGTARGVIHTLEGTNLDLGAPYYHIGFKDTGTTVDIRQWRSLDVAAKSLKNGPDPVQTNRQGTANIQPCIIGYAADSPALSDHMIVALAEFVVWCETNTGVPAVSPVVWYGPEGYGTGAPGRLTIPAWETFTGWAGHQHVPDDNDHWDPGQLPWSKIQTVINELKGANMAVPSWGQAAWDWAVEYGVDKSGHTDAEFETPITEGRLMVFLHNYHRELVKDPAFVPAAGTSPDDVIAEIVARLQ